MRRPAVAFALVGVSFVAVACPSTREPTGSAPVTVPSVAAGGAPTAAAAIRELCVSPAGTAGATHSSPGPTPPEVAEVEDQVEQVRGLTYEHPVAVTAVDDDEMRRRVEESFDRSYPAEAYDRRTAAWRTIGVIPPGADLREALRTFLGGQVLGFYDSETGELVYEGSGELDVQERLVLAHELTHALDDQRFDLSRLDALGRRCQDEASEAALGVVEGNAQFVSASTLARFSPGDLGDVLGALLQGLGDQPDLAGVPPFVQALEIWPYTAGLTFVTGLELDGGTAAVDAALRHPPTTTEQVIHPERYPSDVPSPVDVPDLSAALGPGWGDLDAMQVGEEWLDAMLRLRLDGSVADDASAGWDGGVYRAWSDGDAVAVVMDTAWDSAADATAFADAMNDWNGDGHASVHADGDHVRLAFSSSSDVQRRLDAAIASA
jgi:hypothetical protein